MSRTVTRLAALLAGVAISVAPLSAQPAAAAVSLTISPITWDVVGLDSNDVNTGPNRFPVGARVCAVGGTATSVTAVFTWDTANANVNLRPGSLSSVDLGSIGIGACADAYFEAEITRTPAAYDTVRQYHVTATDAGSGASIATPRPRQIYVEHLISQNRNGITSVALNGTTIAAGGTMTLIQGRTYDITMSGYTATQGYNQLEAFTGLPNTVFQILSVNSTYTSFGGPVTSPWSRLYADACTWENDPNNPNYRSCTGGDYKAGGTVSVTYHVRIIGGAGDPAAPLISLLYDFSGSSYHYNADAGTGVRYLTVVSPSSLPITKTFTPRAITPGGTSTLTFRVANPTPDTVTGITFGDTFPAGLVVANPTGLSITGCGAGSFSPAVAAGATSLSFTNGSISAYGTCTASVSVTAATGGTYVNTTGHLYVDTTVDTGNTGTDTLNVAAAAACTPGQTLAHWTVPATTSTNPPDTAGGTPTTKGSGVTTATALASIPANTSIITTSGHLDSTSWSTFGYKNANQAITFTVDTSKYSQVQMSYWVANPGASNGPSSMVLAYSTGGGYTPAQTVVSPAAAMTSHTVDFTGLTNTSGNTVFRFTATGANNDQSGANLDFDDILFTGCFNAPPAPTLTKTFTSDPIIKGATSLLGFTLNNTQVGNVALTGIAFTDVLPAGLTVTDGSAAGCGGTVTRTAPRTIALSGGTLTAGGSCSFNVTVTGATEGAYTNITGYVSTTEGGTSSSYATDTISVIAPPAIAKDFSPASILLNGTSELSFTVGNPNGHVALTGVDFSDTLPAGVTVASNGGVSACGGTLTTTSPNAISLAGATLAEGAACTFAVTVTGVSTGTKVNTTGNVTSTEGGAGGTATANLVVNDPVKRLDLNKQISSDGVTWRKFVGVFTGDDVYYRFSVYNAGDVAITGTDIVDPEVAGCTWSGAPNPTLQPGDTAYCTTTVPVVAVAGGNANTAYATGSTTIGGVTSADSTATYGTYGLTIDKSATQTYFNAAGNVLDYSFLVTNTGTVPLPGPVTVADDTTTNETCPALTTVGDFDDWLDPLEAITCTASYTVLAGDVTTKHVTNVASATVDDLTTATDTVTVPLAAITIDKTSTTASITVAGQVVPYVITITNTGELTLTGLTVTDATCDSGPSYSSGDTGADDVFAAGEAWVYTCDRTVTQGNLDAGGNLTNTASADTDQTPSKNATLNIPVSVSTGLTLAKSVTETYFTTAGVDLHYSYLVTNTGDTTLAGPVTVADDKATVDCPVVASLAPGASTTCTATYTVGAGDVTAGHVTNTATASAGGLDSNDDTVTVPLAAMTIDKVADTPLVSAPGDVTFTITVTNTGELALTGISFLDSLDGAAHLVSGDATNPGVLDPGEAWIYSATVTVTQTDLDFGQAIINTAYVSSDQTAEISDPAEVDMNQDPQVALDKSADTDLVTVAGDVIGYTLLVTNTGNVSLTGVSVIDGNCDSGPDYVSGDADVDSTLDLTETWTYTCDHTVTQVEIDGGVVSNTATVTTTEEATDTASVDVTANGAPSLSIEKTAGETTFAAEGDTLHYTYVVTNSGGTTLAGPVTVTDDRAEVDCPVVESLAPGDDVTCTATYTVTALDVETGHVTNVAFASADGTDSPEDTVTVRLAAFTVAKTSETTIVGLAGDMVTYEITITNTGEATLTGLVVDDPTCDATPAYASGDTGADEVFEAGEAWVYTCERTVTQDEIDAGGFLSNTVTVTTDEAGEKTDTLDIEIVWDPELTVVKTIVGTSVFRNVGDILRYEYLVTNTGNVTVEGPITVYDDKTSVDCPPVDALAPDESITCTSEYAVTAEDVAAGSVTNIATAAGMVGGQPITSPVVDVRAEQAARPSISVPPSSTVDAKRGAPLTGSSGLVAILVLVAGLAFGLLVARPRRRRTSRRS